ncbi:hypothetical protein MLD38_008838 [Melastoma candidum]|uniref:Uncharacterized protein n=1 Tax=Melastoma candidum TaxID=119954 RepID=A0ACB9RVC9_9MYRT|nr:hypothetical protein MLD38_008838 [Melastoma candidum]
MMSSDSTRTVDYESSSSSGEEEETENWDDWTADDGEDDEGLGVGDSRGAAAASGVCILCLFCDAKFDASNASSLFDHCARVHAFDFGGIRKSLGLDFYGSFKLLNYVRSRVAENRCWSCGEKCDSNDDLLNHLHEATISEDVRQCLEGDSFLKPFLQKDPLLYSFNQDEEDDEEDGDDYSKFVIKEEISQDCLNQIEGISFGDGNSGEEPPSECIVSAGRSQVNPTSHVGGTTCSRTNGCSAVGKSIANNLPADVILTSRKEDKQGKNGVKKLVAANSVRSVNENYFGAYSSFGIHREMLSDKIRMEAYSKAILKNPSLFSDAVVMDVGCGTGILSLFAAQAGASRVIAVEASEKMAAVACQIAKDNGFWKNGTTDGSDNACRGAVEVIHTMVEDLIDSKKIQPHSIDVLVSEWMGYCLLYESMLSSVLLARDQWLKPGGAILPDTATMYVAGFGKGATSTPFWEDVYGFDMSSIGKEILEDSARNPIVDVVSSTDLVTDAVILQNFDLVTMKSDDVDFTATVEIVPREAAHPTGTNNGTTWCYGVVLWFETGFTERFCESFPTVLSTSPYTMRTHWSQTILTFREPIAMSLETACTNKEAEVGTSACPVVKIRLRVSIARAPEHRSIDITVEPTGISSYGRKRSFPLQIFNMQ